MHDALYDVVTAAVLALVAYGSTNIDNLVLLAALVSGGRNVRPVVVGFSIGSMAILILALSFSLLSLVLEPVYLSLLGIVPLVLGLRLLFAQRSDTASGPAILNSAPAIAIVLIANSIDTMAVFGPMFAESQTIVVVGLAAGFLMTATLWLLLVIKISQRSQPTLAIARFERKLVPVVMIMIGCYILADTWTDLQ